MDSDKALCFNSAYLFSAGGRGHTNPSNPLWLRVCVIFNFSSSNGTRPEVFRIISFHVPTMLIIVEKCSSFYVPSMLIIVLKCSSFYVPSMLIIVLKCSSFYVPSILIIVLKCSSFYVPSILIIVLKCSSLFMLP